VEREDLWLVALKGNPGKTNDEFISDLRDVADLFLDLFNRPAAAIAAGPAPRCDRPPGCQGLAGTGESGRPREEHSRQMSSRDQPEEQWSISDAGVGYLAGRGIN
jgi:hypothetical protein